MSDWTDLGFPAPQSGNYGFDRDVGILRTPFGTAWPRQKQGWKDKRETFNVWCMISASQLATAETFFADDAYDWFTMPLINGDAAGVADYTVRASSPCSFTPLGMEWWKAQFTVETQITAAAPDLTDPGNSLVEETCCLVDDIQCCESE